MIFYKPYNFILSAVDGITVLFDMFQNKTRRTSFYKSIQVIKWYKDCLKRSVKIYVYAPEFCVGALRGDLKNDIRDAIIGGRKIILVIGNKILGDKDGNNYIFDFIDDENFRSYKATVYMYDGLNVGFNFIIANKDVLIEKKVRRTDIEFKSNKDNSEEKVIEVEYKGDRNSNDKKNNKQLPFAAAIYGSVIWRARLRHVFRLATLKGKKVYSKDQYINELKGEIVKTTDIEKILCKKKNDEKYTPLFWSDIEERERRAA